MRGVAFMLAVVATAVALANAGTINTFPYASCTKKPSPYSLVPTIRTAGPNTFCFTILVNQPVPNCNAYCCTADLRKILIDVNPKCVVRSPNINTTLNGVPTKVGAAFEPGVNGPNGTYVLRVTQLGLNTTNAGGAEVCVSLGPNSLGAGCLTMRDFCKSSLGDPPGTCAVALFDIQNDCCPVAKANDYVTPPPPPPDHPPPTVLPNVPPCTTCFSFILERQNVGAPGMPRVYNLTAEQCQAWTDIVVSEVTARASMLGAVLLPGLPAVVCTDDRLMVCMKFASDGEGQKLSDNIYDLERIMWSPMVKSDCYAYWSYPWSTRLRIDDGFGGGCLQTEFMSHCDLAPPPFPSCGCDVSLGATPFFASPFLDKCVGPTCKGITQRANDTVLYCYDVYVSEPRNALSLCGQSQNLLKAEIYANDQRRRKVKAIAVKPAGSNTTRWLSPSWGPTGENTLKVTPLNWSKAQADGARICLEMDVATDLNEFCLGTGDTCSIIFFDNSKNCCPMYRASVS